tara:strand:- start:275 stop:715 length:441 start_codon:yes stop_codon:yes gene_type:complete
MKETFKNKFVLVEKDLMKKGPKSIMSEIRKKNSQGGVYVFIHIKKISFDYIGNSKTIYQRCMIAHQKPSADLAQKMVRDRTGMSEWDYEQKYGRLEGQRMYFKKAKEILAEYEVRVLEYENDPHTRRIKEGLFIRHYNPKFNKQNY